MDPENIEQIENTESPVEIDSWEAAFAALDKKDENNTEGSSDTDEHRSGDDKGTSEDSGNEEIPNKPEDSDSSGDEGISGELDDDAGSVAQENGNAFQDMLGITDEYIKEYKDKLSEDIRNQAIDEIAQEFIKRGIRNNNGTLGATLDDPDICKRDEDGVPRFYNPETGREFTGDNPRRQAQEWVDDYNKELSRAFNQACSTYENHLIKENEPAVAVLEFAPKYEKLDPIRKNMFDNVIEDYELTDDTGKIYGYSCDLDKALALVERQVKAIQEYAKAHRQNHPKEEVSSPALDMKTSSGAVPAGDGHQPTSLAEAMEIIQNQQLEKLKKN